MSLCVYLDVDGQGDMDGGIHIKLKWTENSYLVYTSIETFQASLYVHQRYKLFPGSFYSVL